MIDFGKLEQATLRQTPFTYLMAENVITAAEADWIFTSISDFWWSGV